MDEEQNLSTVQYRVELSKYRLERAYKSLKISKRDFSCGDYNEASSRAYYALFYALLAVNELEGFESSKHSGVISHFKYAYLRTKIFDRRISKFIDDSFLQRRYADYEGFYKASPEDAQKQIDIAEEVISLVQPYLESRWSTMKEE